MKQVKLKYEKSFHDWKESERNFQIADQDGTISRNDVTKMKIFSESKFKSYEIFRTQYSEQLEKTNAEQRKYFDDDLPKVLRSLQDMDRERIQFVRGVMGRVLAEERSCQNF